MQLFTQWRGVSKYMLSQPATFFEHYDEEHGVGYPMAFLALSCVVVMVPFGILSVGSNAPDPAAMAGSAVVLVVFAVGLWLFTVIEAGVAHLLLVLLGASGYSRTLEAYAFPAVIRYAVWWFPLIGVVPGFVGLYLQARALSKFHDVSEVGAAAVVVLAVLLPFVVLVVLAALISLFVLGLGTDSVPQAPAAALGL